MKSESLLLQLRRRGGLLRVLARELAWPLRRIFRIFKLGWRRVLRTAVVRIDGVHVHTSENFVPRSVQAALFKGSYEERELHLLKRILRPGHRVLDIGAGIGLTSLLATRIVGEGRVLSYEANPAMRRVIEANFRLNGLTPNLRMKAVTADSRNVAFFQNADIVGSSMFDKGLETDPLMVGSDAIGDVVEEHRPNVVVMDAEGTEAELIPALNLDGVEYLLVEFHPRILGKERLDALVSDLGEAGFERLQVGSGSGVGLFRRKS